jgi:hypothetical protein
MILPVFNRPIGLDRLVLTEKKAAEPLPQH